MTYEEYIRYHRRGDAGVEERMIASLCRALALNGWDSFRLIYYYTMTYHIPSALDMLHGYDWGRATGYNANSSERRAKFMGMSMADYMRWLWNNPQAGQSPYTLFEGALVPAGKDADGNIVYHYNGAKF